MRSTKLTPTEVLQRQKARLRLKSDALTEALEGNLNYVQHNMGTIVTNSVTEAVVSKSPPIVQSLLGRSKGTETGSFDHTDLIGGALDILPLFIKGSKGWLIRLVLDQARKWIFRRK